jgi:hypothetical protein
MPSMRCEMTDRVHASVRPRAAAGVWAGKARPRLCPKGDASPFDQ